MPSIRKKKRVGTRGSIGKRKATVPRRAATELDLRRTPMQARGQATFEGILDATATLLDEVGGERLTTNLIANAAGVNVATLYQYFPNKQTVLLELFRRLSDRQVEVTDARLAGLSGASDWPRVLGQVIQDIVDLRAKTRGTVALRQLMRSSPDLLTHEQDYAKHTAATLAQELRNVGVRREQALLVARCAIEATSALLDLWLIETGGRDARIVAEAKALAVSYLAPHFGKGRGRRG
jgi:AcrR family transcriptional regulator